MTTLPATLAAILSLLIAGVHVVFGGRDIAAPLKACTALSDEARSVAWMCWHLVTIQILTLSALLGAGAYLADPRLVLAGALLATAMTLWCLIAARLMGQTYATMPQGWIFAPVAALSTLALLL